MRVNVYSQELTSEVIQVMKESNTGAVYKAAQLVLHSSPMLHHVGDDDDRSAVTFWLPSSEARCEEMAQAFETIAAIFRGKPRAVEALPIDHPSVAIGGWLAAALDDAAVCEEMKRDIRAWMDAGKPMVDLSSVPDPVVQVTPLGFTMDRIGYVMRIRMLGILAREETLTRHGLTMHDLPTRDEVAKAIPVLGLPPLSRSVFWVREDDNVHTISYYPERDALVRESVATGVIYKVTRHA